MSKKTLYRQYRPQSFDDVFGQAHVKKTIEQALKDNTYAHSYLFSGPRGVGKTTIARIVSRSVNCVNRKEGEFEPCNECDACVSILNNSAIDVVEIDAASNRGIDEVRQLRENARTSTNVLKKKVFIIDEVHMLTREAFDALLKTLEEPGDHVMFVLATTELHKIPATIISRCQVFEFKTLSMEDLVAYLRKIADTEKRDVSDEVLQFVAKMSGGYVRDAVSLLGQVFTFKTNSVDEIREFFGVAESADVVDFISSVLSKDARNAFSVIQKVRSQGRDIARFSDMVLEYARIGIMMRAGGQGDFGFDGMVAESMGVLISQYDIKLVSAFVSRLAAYINQFSAAGYADLAIDLVVAELCEFGAVIEVSKSIEKPVSKPIQSAQQAPALASDPAKSEVAEAQAVDIVEKTVPEKIEKEVSQAVEQERVEVAEVVEEVSQPVESEPVTSVVDENGVLNLEGVQSRWNDVIKRVYKDNKPLGAVLKNTCILGVKSGTLVLVVDFELHRDRVNSSLSRELITQSFQEVLGAPHSYQCEIVTDLTPDEQERVNNIRNVESAQKKAQLSETYDIVTDVFGVSEGS